MFTFIVKEKEVAPADTPYAFAGLGSLAFTPVTKILLGGAAALSIGMAGTIAWLTFTKQGLEIDLLEAQGENTRIQFELDTCRTKIDEQNAQIDQIRKDAEDDIALIDSVNDQLNKVIEIQDREVDRLKEIPVPQTCEEAQQLLRDNLDLFRSEG